MARPSGSGLRRAISLVKPEVELARDACSPRAARRLLEEAFAPALSRSEMDTARLLATELVTNAVLHGRGAIGFRAELSERRLLVEVADQGSGFERSDSGRGVEPGRGWGLALVASASSRWGIRDAPGTRVWFELDRPHRSAGGGAAV